MHACSAYDNNNMIYTFSKALAITYTSFQYACEKYVIMVETEKESHGHVRREDTGKEWMSRECDESHSSQLRHSASSKHIHKDFWCNIRKLGWVAQLRRLHRARIQLSHRQATQARGDQESVHDVASITTLIIFTALHWQTPSASR